MRKTDCNWQSDETVYPSALHHHLLYLTSQCMRMSCLCRASQLRNVQESLLARDHARQHLGGCSCSPVFHHQGPAIAGTSHGNDVNTCMGLRSQRRGSPTGCPEPAIRDTILSSSFFGTRSGLKSHNVSKITSELSHPFRDRKNEPCTLDLGSFCQPARECLAIQRSSQNLFAGACAFAFSMVPPRLDRGPTCHRLSWRWLQKLVMRRAITVECPSAPYQKLCSEQPTL